MTTTYHLNVNELSVELLNSIKAAFKDKTVDITVSESMDETEYLLSSEANKKMLDCHGARWPQVTVCLVFFC